MKEFGFTYNDILELYDELFHLFIDKLFHLMGKQIGMGATGYDFRSEEKKKLEDWLNS